MTSPAYIFLDLETTGLDSSRDEITEAAWLFEDPRVATGWREREFLVRHSRPPSRWVAARTNYSIPGRQHVTLQRVCAQIAYDVAFLARDPNGKEERPVYLVGACPSFDDRFLRRRFVETPYHYHVIDVETLVMGAFGLDAPPTLSELTKLTGVTNARPHEALADARHARDLFVWWKAKLA